MAEKEKKDHSAQNASGKYEKPTTPMKSNEPTTGGLPDGLAPEMITYMQGLISTFNTSAASLKDAYSALQVKFDRLNLKLEETNRELSTSLDEQERLSNYLTNILDSLSSGVLVVDTSGCITLFNRGAENITGITVDDALGKHYREVMGQDTPEDLTPLWTLSSGERHLNMEKPIRTQAGQAIPVGYSTSPLVNKLGEMIGAVEIFMDLSIIKSLEEEISRMDKLAALGQMAATMAHKIRNPLGGIAGFAGLLQLELKDNENGKRIVGKIVEGVGKLNHIVTSLLSYTAHLRLKVNKIDLKERIEHIIGGLKDELPEETGGIFFSVDEPTGSMSAEVDVEHFSEAVHHIIRNSIEAVENDGSVSVLIFHGEYEFNPDSRVLSDIWQMMKDSSSLLESRLPCAVVIVSDTGTGMENDIVDKLFVPFFTTKENGNGLGLAAARKIIEAHHGELLVSSIVGKGTAVGMLLPLTSVV